jgi:hypothetical protein
MRIKKIFLDEAEIFNFKKCVLEIYTYLLTYLFTELSPS